MGPYQMQTYRSFVLLLEKAKAVILESTLSFSSFSVSFIKLVNQK